ncbi:MAG: serine hydrolase domain-containing protein [Syntrophomonadaceae bacterium]
MKKGSSRVITWGQAPSYWLMVMMGLWVLLLGGCANPGQPADKAPESPPVASAQQEAGVAPNQAVVDQADRFEVVESDQIPGWKKLNARVAVNEWARDGSQPLNDDRRCGFSIHFPGSWTLNSAVFYDADHHKVGELPPPVVLKSGQEAEFLDSSPVPDEELISHQVFNTKTCRGSKTITKIATESGSWYPHKYRLIDGSYGFSIFLYSRALNSEDEILYDQVVNTFSLEPAAGNIQDTSLEAFLDQTLNSKLEQYHIPNATAVVVKDGQIVYKKGFGRADIEQDIPVDPDTTLFRIGSTSKLITWTAVMQMVESGQLDLNTDINRYLDFEIPPRLEKPLQNTSAALITMTHLMTHTPGFEDYPSLLFRLSADDLLPLDEYIKNHRPARIFPAGEVAAYSNYGTALAGYIVERLSGQPFADYVEENIFAPLQMDNSTYRQPPALTPPTRLAKPYRFVNGAFTEAGFEYIMLEPAGSMSSTAADMAKFMLAHLSGGAYDGGRILKPETVQEMHQRHFSYDPALGGMTLGFMEGVCNDREVLFHGGSTMLYNTGLYLLPEANTGIFISYSGGNHLLHAEVFQEFMDFCYPVSAAINPLPGPGSRERAREFTGEYLMNRKSVTTDDKITALLGGGIIKVAANEEGYLLVTNGGETDRFVEIGPGVYQNLRVGPSRDAFGRFHQIIFKQDPLGRTMLTTDGPMTYSKAPFYSTLNFTAAAALGIVLIVIGSLLYWIIRMVAGWFRKTNRQGSRYYALASWVGIFTGITILVLFASQFSAPPDPVYQLPPEAYLPAAASPLLAVIPVLLWVLAGLLVSLTVIAWRKGLWGRMARVHYSLFTLAVIGLLWMLHYWNIFI